MSNRKSRRSRRLLRLESLEGRQMLAGNITAYLSGANLLINGDNLANGVLINALPGTPGRVTITPVDNNGATTLNGNAVALTLPSFGDIRISLGGGSDTLDFQGDPADTDSLPGSLVIDGGLGNNTLTVSNYDIGTNLSIRNGSGNDTVVLDNVDVGLDITVDNGTGSGAQSLSVQTGSTVGRDLRVSHLGGNVNVNLGETSATGGTGDITVGRNVSVLNRGTVANTADITLQGITIANDLTIISNTDSKLLIGEDNGPATVAHDTALALGALGNTITFDDGTSLGTNARDRLSILNGNGDDIVNFITATVNATSTIFNGNGAATVGAAPTSAFNAALSIVNLNTGDHAVTIDSTDVGPLSIFNGTTAGDNSVNVGTATNVNVNGPLTVRNAAAGGPAGNTTSITNATLNGLTTISNATGTGNTVNLGTFGGGAGALTANGNVNIFNGDTNSTLTVDDVTVNGNLTSRAGDGPATPAHQASIGTAGAVTITGNLAVLTYDGDTNIDLDQLTLNGNLNLRTGAGIDTVNLGLNGATGLTVNGNTQIDLGAGGGVGDTLNIGAQTAAVTLVGQLSVRMGSGADTVTIGSSTVGGAGTALGDGFFYFDGGAGDPAGANIINVDVTVIDPFVDLITLNKFKNFNIVV